uniref:Uncharacterized protein n=1 Tax=viral metagenome TaxID=1070528 RepID=A0A6C0EY60_9ZZZZ
MSFTDFIKTDNKSIIWGLLQEGGIFNDIPNNRFENVKQLFEASILSMKPEFDIFFDKNDEGDEDYDKKASDMIINSNKGVIKKMITELGKFKNRPPQPQSQSQSQSQPHHQPLPPRMQSESSINMDPQRVSLASSSSMGKKPKIEEIYRADDLQKHRMSEIEVRLKEKQEEMDTMLNTKKPEHIDFSDNKLNDNKLASDEMERLIAHALSSRQQELEHLTMNKTLDKSKNAEEWISGSNDPVANALNASIAIKRSQDIKRPREQNQTLVSTPVSPVLAQKKNVSFNERDNSEFVYNTDLQDKDSGNGNDNTVTSQPLSFLSKLKRKPIPTNDNNDNNDNTSNIHPSMQIPLDNFMTEYNNRDSIDDDDDDSSSGMHLFINEKTRDIREARDYDKLDERINKIQNDMENIKNTQEKILELLKLQHQQKLLPIEDLNYEIMN